MCEVTVLLPALNEEKSIGLVIDEIRSLSVDYKILVVDNGSKDKTPIVARGKNTDLCFVFCRGKGNAIRESLRFIDTPYTIMMNSDYTYPAEYLQTISGILRLGGYDVVIGCRQFKEPGSMSAANSFGNWSLSLIAYILFGYRLNDLCTGMWGFKTDVLRDFNLVSEGFTLEADLFINSVRNKCKITQIPIGYRPRLDGSHPKLKIWDGFKIGRFLIRNRWKQ